MKPEIWLHSHTDTMGFEAKAATDGAKAWMDPDCYAKFVAVSALSIAALIRYSRIFHESFDRMIGMLWNTAA